MKLQPCRLIRP